MSSFYRGEILQADELNGEFAKAVQRTGDTMAGSLILAHDPVVPLEAATKRYADNILSNFGGSFLPTTGGTLTGPLMLARDPLVSMEAATKQYVDSETAGVIVSDTSPSSPSNGDLWFDSVTTQLYVHYDDGNSAQWIIATNQPITTPPGTSGASVTVADTPPASPNPGDMWWDSVGTQLYLRYNDGNTTQWVPATNQTGGVGEAASDGYQYARRNAAWSRVATPDVGRNLIHNAMFIVQQRGAGPFTTGVYTLDRWLMIANTDTFSVASASFSDAQRAQIGDESAQIALSNTFTGNAAAAAFHLITQRIENVRILAGTTVTVSFWASSATGLKLGVSIDQLFGTGGSPSAAVFGSGQLVTLTSTLARYSVSLTVPSVAGKTLGTSNDHCTCLNLWFSSSSTNATRAGSVGVQSGTIILWGVQLEIGSVATSLEKRDPMLELQQCQRFYQTATFRVSGYAVAAVGLATQSALPVQMRAAPVIATSGTTTINTTSPVVSANSAILTTSVTATATGGVIWSGTYTASADL